MCFGTDGSAGRRKSDRAAVNRRRSSGRRAPLANEKVGKDDGTETKYSSRGDYLSSPSESLDRTLSKQNKLKKLKSTRKTEK